MSLPLAVVIGSLGALAGGFLLGGLGLAARGLFGSMITATVGALLSLLLAGSFLRST